MIKKNKLYHNFSFLYYNYDSCISCMCIFKLTLKAYCLITLVLKCIFYSSLLTNGSNVNEELEQHFSTIPKVTKTRLFS